MNANEVIAELASRRLGRPVHPNDHVNRGQSSNDTIPSAIHVAAALQLHREVVPALEALAAAIAEAAGRAGAQLKTGRTHLMDAMPMRVADELGAWRSQLATASTGCGRPASGCSASPRAARRSGQGSMLIPNSAAASPRNSHGAPAWPSGPLPIRSRRLPPGHGRRAVGTAAGRGGVPVEDRERPSMDELRPAGRPRRGRVARLAARLQHHARKVNPVVPESVLMACAAVVGHDASVAVAGQSEISS